MAGSTPSRSEPEIFLGYLARKPWVPAAGWDPERKTGVNAACSVSDCMCERTPDWEKRWDFNQATCYGTPDEARAAVPTERSDEYALFAYWVVCPEDQPTMDGEALPFDARLPALPAGPGPDDFEHLGFDVVGLGTLLPPFEHSPLSCNNAALEVSVNRCCLLDELARARSLAAAWGAANGVGVEPGRYYVVRVARERR